MIRQYHLYHGGLVIGAFNPSFPIEKLIYQLRAFEQLNFTQQNYSITYRAEVQQKKKMYLKRKNRDRHARTPNLVFVVASHYQKPSNYGFALTRMSFRDLPLL